MCWNISTVSPPLPQLKMWLKIKKFHFYYIASQTRNDSIFILFESNRGKTAKFCWSGGWFLHQLSTKPMVAVLAQWPQGVTSIPGQIPPCWAEQGGPAGPPGAGRMQSTRHSWFSVPASCEDSYFRQQKPSWHTHPKAALHFTSVSSPPMHININSFSSPIPIMIYLQRIYCDTSAEGNVYKPNSSCTRINF